MNTKSGGNLGTVQFFIRKGESKVPFRAFEESETCCVAITKQAGSTVFYALTTRSLLARKRGKDEGEGRT